MTGIENRVWRCNLQVRGVTNRRRTNKKWSIFQNLAPRPNAKNLWVGD